MAEVPVYIAGVQVGDSAKLLASAAFHVSAADAKAYVAAADAAARAATDVGLLLVAALNITRATGTNQWRRYYVESSFMNDSYAPPAADAAIYNSNKWKVTGQTTNAGIPAVDTVYIPEYLVTGVVMAADGISADLTDPPVSSFVTQFLATALSKYQTAFTSVISIQRNDS